MSTTLIGRKMIHTGMIVVHPAYGRALVLSVDLMGTALIELEEGVGAIRVRVADLIPVS